MHTEKFEADEQQFSSEQMAAIRSLDTPSVPTPRSPLSKAMVFTTTVVGLLIASAIWKLLNPDLAWLVTFPPGLIALLYVSRRGLLGKPLGKRIAILFATVNGVFLGSGLWYLALLGVKYHVL
jgi:4-hydroxybenzoate polyprenyltransferase